MDQNIPNGNENSRTSGKRLETVRMHRTQMNSSEASGGASAGAYGESLRGTDVSSFKLDADKKKFDDE